MIEGYKKHIANINLGYINELLNVLRVILQYFVNLVSNPLSINLTIGMWKNEKKLYMLKFKIKC